MRDVNKCQKGKVQTDEEGVNYLTPFLLIKR